MLRQKVTRVGIARAALVVLVSYLAIVAITVMSVQRAANSFTSADISTTLGGGETELERLADRFSVFKRRFQNLKVLIYPVRQIAKIAVVVPPLERQREVAELLLLRVDADHDAATAALALAGSFYSLQSEYLDDSISIADVGTSGLDRALVALESESEAVLDVLSEVSVLRTQVSDIGVSGPLSALDGRMTVQEVKIEQIAEFSRLLSGVLLIDLDLVSRAENSFSDLKLFLDGELSLSELNARIRIISERAHTARTLVQQLKATTPEGLSGTSQGELVAAVTDLNIAIDDLFEGIADVIDAAEGAFDALGSGDGWLLSDGAAISSSIQLLMNRQDELGKSVGLITRGVESLENIRAGQLFSLGELGGFLDDPRFNRLLGMSTFLQQIPDLMTEVLGTDGTERKYLVLGQTSDELRAAGGFTSSVWLLTFRSGALVDNQYLDVATFEDREWLELYPEAYEELQLHMDAGRMYMRDAGWDPNFPSAAALAAEIYETRTGTSVDGVISLTQWALVDLASAIGGIEVDSRLVSSDELLSIMESGTDEGGSQFLTSLFDALLDSFSGSRVGENFLELLTSTTALFDSKDLMIYGTTPEVEMMFASFGWDGRLDNPSNDRLGIFDSNVGWNKVDRNIDRGFTYSVDLSDISNIEAKLELSYFNDSKPADLSTNCETQSHRPDAYDILLNGCYWNYIRVYIPGGARLVESDDLPLQDGTIAVRIGGLVAGRPTVQQLFDENGDYISGFLILDSQLSEVVTLNYVLPSQILVNEDEYVEYSLDVIAQPGTRGRSGTVELRLPDGYELVDSRPDFSSYSDGLLVFSTDLVHDEQISLKLRNTLGVSR